MTESEKVTRKKRIDTKLESSLLNWKIISNDEVTDTSALIAHAVEEYPTETGPADYALFVEGRLLGIIEAKKIAVGAENVLEQAKRYSRGVPNTVGEWRDYRVPFLYSTNGEMILHIEAYSNASPEATPWDLLIAIQSETFRMGSIRLAERKIASDMAPVYMYLFAFEVDDMLKAAHGMEVSFAFSNVRHDSRSRPEALHVETDMSEAWIAFARTGNPDHPAMPPWPAYTLEKRSTMIFDAISHVVDDPYGDERRLWGELGSRWYGK